MIAAISDSLLEITSVGFKEPKRSFRRTNAALLIISFVWELISNEINC